MSESALASLTQAAAEDLPAIVELLVASGLPTRDISATAHPEFLVARRDGRVIACIGLEGYGDTGLLRSLAVLAEHRGTGLGIALTRALERHAWQAGLARLVLLTETAEAFFRRRGYHVIARAEAPAAVRDSEEFRSLCPVSAVCMKKERKPAS